MYKTSLTSPSSALVGPAKRKNNKKLQRVIKLQNTKKPGILKKGNPACEEGSTC